MDLNNHEGQLYCVVLKEAPSPPRWKHYVFSKTAQTCYSIPHDVDIRELEIGQDGEQRGLLNAFPVVRHYNEMHDFAFAGVIEDAYEEDDFDDDECDELWKACLEHLTPLESAQLASKENLSDEEEADKPATTETPSGKGKQ